MKTALPSLPALFLALFLAFSSPLFASVTVSSPANGSTVASPAMYRATATAPSCSLGVAAVGIYVDNARVYLVNGSSLNTPLTLNPGTYQTVVQEWDYCGGTSTTAVNITVQGRAPGGVSVSVPANNSTVSSPAQFTATATEPSCANGVAAMGVYIDNQLAYVVNGSQLNTQIPLSPGRHATAVQEWDFCGGSTNTPVEVTAVNGTTCPSVPLVEAGPQPFPTAPPSPAPDPGSTAAGSVCVSNPTSGASVTSPMTMTAVANLLQAPIKYMRVYLDGNADYFTFYNQFTAQFWMPNGNHTIEVIATDTNGNNVSKTFPVTVVGAGDDQLTNLQNIPGWEPCTSLYAPGTPRAGQICADGNGNAVSTMTEGVASPPLSGSSAHFTMTGPTPYTNELYTLNLGGGDNPTNFIYDFYVMVDKPAAPQALEFDVNQTINSTRWVFGTECNFYGNYPNVGEWDVWDGSTTGGWVKTSAPCPAFAANTWNHITWTFQRVGQQVHYVSLQVNGTTYPLNLYLPAQPDWTMGQINAAFQMDSNALAVPYNVWLDKVSLTVY